LVHGGRIDPAGPQGLDHGALRRELDDLGVGQCLVHQVLRAHVLQHRDAHAGTRSLQGLVVCVLAVRLQHEGHALAVVRVRELDLLRPWIVDGHELDDDVHLVRQKIGDPRVRAFQHEVHLARIVEQTVGHQSAHVDVHPDQVALGVLEVPGRVRSVGADRHAAAFENLVEQTRAGRRGRLGLSERVRHQEAGRQRPGSHGSPLQHVSTLEAGGVLRLGLGIWAVARLRILLVHDHPRLPDDLRATASATGQQRWGTRTSLRPSRCKRQVGRMVGQRQPRVNICVAISHSGSQYALGIKRFAPGRRPTRKPIRACSRYRSMSAMRVTVMKALNIRSVLS